MTHSVTILLSVHNSEATLDRCLDSIAHQTFPDFYILALDDASTDRSQELLGKWKKKFGEHRMNILRNSSQHGLTFSLNRGIDAVQTPFIARIDDDDWWEPTKLEKQIRFLEENPGYGVIGTNYINHSKAREKKIYLPETDEAIKKTIFWRNPFAHSAVMYRTDLVRAVGKYNRSVRYAQDYELWVRCFPKTRFYNLQEFLCHRTLGEGISVERQNKQMRLYLRVLRIYLPKYHRPFKEYGAMIEPLIVLATPEWIKRIKRKFLF